MGLWVLSHSGIHQCWAVWIFIYFSDLKCHETKWPSLCGVQSRKCLVNLLKSRQYFTVCLRQLHKGPYDGASSSPLPPFLSSAASNLHAILPPQGLGHLCMHEWLWEYILTFFLFLSNSSLSRLWPRLTVDMKKKGLVIYLTYKPFSENNSSIVQYFTTYGYPYPKPFKSILRISAKKSIIVMQAQKKKKKVVTHKQCTMSHKN